VIVLKSSTARKTASHREPTAGDGGGAHRSALQPESTPRARASTHQSAAAPTHPTIRPAVYIANLYARSTRDSRFRLVIMTSPPAADLRCLKRRRTFGLLRPGVCAMELVESNAIPGNASVTCADSAHLPERDLRNARSPSPPRSGNQRPALWPLGGGPRAGQRRSTCRGIRSVTFSARRPHAWGTIAAPAGVLLRVSPNAAGPTT